MPAIITTNQGKDNRKHAQLQRDAEKAQCGVAGELGFEPVISSLRGRCPRPLDECALNQRKLAVYFNAFMAIEE